METKDPTQLAQPTKARLSPEECKQCATGDYENCTNKEVYSCPQVAMLYNQGAADGARAVSPSIQERHDYRNKEQLLLNLLAIIHRDGGQTTDKLGISKSAQLAADIAIAEIVTRPKEVDKTVTTELVEPAKFITIELQQTGSIRVLHSPDGQKFNTLCSFRARDPMGGLTCTNPCNKEMKRSSGDAECPQCHRQLRLHPYCRGLKIDEARPVYVLHVDCEGNHHKL